MNDELIDMAKDNQVMSARPTLESLPKQVYVNGQAVEDKNAEGYTRRGQVEKLLFQLHMALTGRAKEIEELWDASLVSKELLDGITLVFKQADEAIMSTIEHKTVGAPPTLSDARAALKVAHSFKKAVNVTNDLSHEFLSWVDELMQDLEHYALRIEMAYLIVNTDANGRPKPPNRPTNLSGKKGYWKLVQEHRASNEEDTFPKHKFAREKLADQGINVTTKTISNWRKQIEEGTFFHFVQSKKRK